MDKVSTVRALNYICLLTIPTKREKTWVPERENDPIMSNLYSWDLNWTLKAIHSRDFPEGEALPDTAYREVILGEPTNYHRCSRANEQKRGISKIKTNQRWLLGLNLFLGSYETNLLVFQFPESWLNLFPFSALFWSLISYLQAPFSL